MGLHSRLTEKLMLALDESSALGFHEKQADFFLWATILGGTAARETALQSWFIENLRCTPYEVRVDTWPTIASILSSFLLLDEPHQEDCRRFWDKACDTMGARTGWP